MYRCTISRVLNIPHPQAQALYRSIYNPTSGPPSGAPSGPPSGHTSGTISQCIYPYVNTVLHPLLQLPAISYGTVFESVLRTVPECATDIGGTWVARGRNLVRYRDIAGEWARVLGLASEI